MPDVSQCLTTHHMCLKYANLGGSHNVFILEMSIVSFHPAYISICVIAINWTVGLMGNIL